MEISLLESLHFLDTIRCFIVKALILDGHSICHQNLFSEKPPAAYKHASPYVIKSGSLSITCAIGVSNQYLSGSFKISVRSLRSCYISLLMNALCLYLYISFVMLLCTYLSMSSWFSNSFLQATSEMSCLTDFLLLVISLHECKHLFTDHLR